MEDLCDPGMIIKAWPNSDTYPAFGEALADAEAAGRSSAVRAWICESEGGIKQKAAPKDPFRIAADRNSFGESVAVC